MAVYTDFFIASDDELKAAFPNRFPVADNPVIEEVMIQSTGEKRLIRVWQSAQPFPEIDPTVTYPSKEEAIAVQRLPLVQFKNVDPVKLAMLQQILVGGEFDELIEGLLRPALIAPGDDNSMLYCLPSTLVDALAVIDDQQVVAQHWCETEELVLDGWSTEDASEIIGALHDFAKEAKTAGKNLYLWVNL
jgi:hypothetical protein